VGCNTDAVLKTSPYNHHPIEVAFVSIGKKSHTKSPKYN